jgi:DNA replication protein DnaC
MQEAHEQNNPNNLQPTITPTTQPLFSSDGIGQQNLVTCEKHGDYTSTLLVTLMPSMKQVWSKCPICEKIRKHEELKATEAAQTAERQAYLEKQLNGAGIPLRYRGKTLDTYMTELEQQAHVLNLAKSFAENFHQHEFNGTALIFSGRVGTGKNHLAIAIAQHIMKNKTVFYISAIDAVRLVRETWKRNSVKTESQVLTEFANVDLLILDEVGVQYGTESEEIILFDIIDKRYRDLKPTIFLTNLSKGDMKSFLGERSFDRLREGGIWVDFLWESYRGH